MKNSTMIVLVLLLLATPFATIESLNALFAAEIQITPTTYFSALWLTTLLVWRGLRRRGG